MIYRSKVDPGAPTALIMLIASQFALGLNILIGGGAPFLGCLVLIFGPAILLLWAQCPGSADIILE